MMIASYSETTDQFERVIENPFLWEMTLGSDGFAHSGRRLGFPSILQMDDGPTPWVNAHGIMMWIAWTFLGCF